MTASEMQACLARMYTDSAFRGLFKLEPRAALDRYVLDASESQAVAAIGWEALENFALTVTEKRRERLQRAYPGLFKAVGRHMGVYFPRYHDVYPLRPGETNSTDILVFGAFMEATLRDAPGCPPFCSELARFQSIMHRLRIEARAAGAEMTDPGRPPLGGDRDGLPVRRRGVSVAHFAFNVSEIDVALLEGRDPVVQQEEEVIVFSIRPENQAPRIVRVNGPTAVVLDLCDGIRSFSGIVEAVETHFGQPGLTGSVSDVLGKLVELDILEGYVA